MLSHRVLRFFGYALWLLGTERKTGFKRDVSKKGRPAVGLGLFCLAVSFFNRKIGGDPIQDRAGKLGGWEEER